MKKRAAEHDEFADIRTSVRALCAKFPGEYWRVLDRERAYPTEFVAALLPMTGRRSWMGAIFF